MNSRKQLLYLWVFFLVLATSVGLSYGKDVQLSAKDKAEIIKSILLKENLLERGRRLGEARVIIYLSTQNISPTSVPQIRDVRFILLDPKDQDNWPKAGFTLFEFSPFEIRGSRVTISLTDSWSNDPHQYSRTDYEFRKKSGKWTGHRVGGGGGRSGHRTWSPVDLTNAPDSELQQHLGERVTMRGKFSLRGKVGPFILAGGRPIYLVSKGTFSWGEPYASMEGKEVRVTGILRFAHYPASPAEALPEGRPADHFYFEAETAKVEMSQR